MLTASRVYPRKRLDLTLAGFALAARRAEGNLYLHLPGVIRYEADKLRARIRELGLEDRVFLNLLDPLDRPLPFARLVALLRAGDIGLTTAMGEGWGLGPFEHAATGAAQVVPDHTSFRENWGVLENGGVRENGRPAALLVPTGAPLLDVHEAVTMRPPEPAAVGEALLTLLRDPARRLELSRRACTRARSPDLAWPSLAQRFDKVLREVVGKNEEATNQPPPPPPPRARRRARP